VSLGPARSGDTPTDPMIAVPDPALEPITDRLWPPALDRHRYVTPHFQLHEFAQGAGYGCPAEPYPEQWVQDRLLPLCEILEVLREYLGAPIAIVSGYRSTRYNAALRAAGHAGVALHSQHCEGRAADVICGRDAPRVHAAVLQLYQEGRLPRLGGLGRYPSWTHLDVRPSASLVRWDG